jgi:transcriptional regulator of NAD metabolism
MKLYTNVDLGGRVLDVIVDHAIYGQLTRQIGAELIDICPTVVRKVDTEQAQPLSRVTDGVHLTL